MPVQGTCIAAAGLFFCSTFAAAACGGFEDPCAVPLGNYLVATPERHGRYPAAIFLHGYGAGGYLALSLGEPMLARGYAVIGPQGLDDENGLASWSLPPRSHNDRNEIAFLREVIQDAAAQHDIDPDRVLLLGHSFGGELTNYIACEYPSLARAYAPIAGTFRNPLPSSDACEGPVNLLHTHGWSDDDVPIEGRAVWDGAFVQGDVFQAMKFWRQVNGCEMHAPNETDARGIYLIRHWATCPAGAITLALHPGGHEIPPDWADLVLDWFETLP